MAIKYSRYLHPQAQKYWSVIVTSRLRLLIAYFSLQMSSFDDPFCTNGTFRGNGYISLNFLDKATKVMRNNFRIIINGTTNL